MQNFDFFFSELIERFFFAEIIIKIELSNYLCEYIYMKFKSFV